MKIRSYSYSAILLLSLLLASGAGFAKDVSAEWKVHHLRFNYSGFTSIYTCEGLKGKLKKLLREIGARNDVEIGGACGTRMNQPFPFFRFTLAFAVPVETDISVDNQTFPAQWDDIKFARNKPRGIDGGDCELLEQFRDQVLKEIAFVENENRLRCIPHQRSIGSVNLQVSVLRAADESAHEISKSDYRFDDGDAGDAVLDGQMLDDQ